MASSEDETDPNTSDYEKQFQNQVKKYRLKRTGNLLIIPETEEELNYRKNFKILNIVTDSPKLVCCTKCNASFVNDVVEGKKIYSHPLLKVLMCGPCCKFYGDEEFSLDEDDEDKYCRWCGEGGKLFLCSKCICGFCPKCIKRNFGVKKTLEIKGDDDWICYFCDPKPLWKLRNICDLAQIQSAANRSNISSSRTSGRTKKTSSCGKNENDASKYDSKNLIGNRKLRHTRASKRFANAKSKGNSSSSSVHSFCENEQPSTKKRKITDSSAKGEIGCLNRDGRKKTGLIENGRKYSSDSSNSESNDELTENENDKLNKKKKTRVDKNKNAEKLKEILKVSEITSELCFQLCKKEIRKLDKKNCSVSNGKLISDCEKLKSIIILMSSSLSTVHNMIISLQQKLGSKGCNSLFLGGDDISLLKTITHILKEKRMKTSHGITIVNDILNRYPCIEMGWKRMNYHSGSNSENKFVDNRDCISDTTRKNHVISKDSSDDIQTKESVVNNFDGFDSVSPGKRENRVARDVKQYCDSGITSNIDSHNRSLEGSDGETLNRACESQETVTNVEPLKKNSFSDVDVDMKQSYENSLKLKEQLLKNSSDEISPSDPETSDSSTVNFNTKRKSSGSKDLEKKIGRKRLPISKEEREIRKLTDLSSLARRVGSEDSNTGTSSEGVGASKRQIRRKNNGVDKEDSSSNNISFISESDNRSCDGEQDVRTEVDFINQCSSLLKDYVLKSTSSECEIDENGGKEGKKSTFEERHVSTLDESKRECISERCSYREDSKSQSSSDNGEESSGWFDLSKRKKKRSARIVISTDSDSSEISPVNSSNLESPRKGRKTIRKILKTGSLELGTRQAVKMEHERKKRIAERNELYEKYFPRMADSERLVLDFDLETGEVLLEAPWEIVKILKPHQKEGVKFMWDNCFESLKNLENDHGSGCILAHCMGLGKSLQIITLLATIMKNDLGVNTVLILCPLNVVNNWVHEFKFWLKDDESIDVHTASGKYKNIIDRYYMIKMWHTNGGVLILSYDIMRNLTNAGRNVKHQVKPSAKITKFLLDPGPDLVVCDEGHVIKNEDTSLSKCVREIKTSRRIVLTGTPFQNNLLEYHSMVQFIKPNILGTKKEFMNRFGNPIRNGQFEDSTALDVKLMRARAHVLHKLLDGCIQRFDYSVLRPFLPEKQEYVISIRLTETQGKLYQYYLERYTKSTASDRRNKLFSDFNWLQKIWTHPKVVLSYMEERENKIGGESELSSGESVVCIEPDASEEAYWKQVIKLEECEDIHSSGKLVILFDILAQCRKLGDKALVFSHSLKNLNLIEYFLHKVHLAKILKEKNITSERIPLEYLDTWVQGVDYFRMDGSTGNNERSKFCKWFNSEKHTRARLFLISTKAGGLGINLVGANRVILFDASWNPSHDVQSIFRVYRFGQTKSCYVYRLVAEATMEEKIYEKQVTKLSLEKRVLDEHQIERHYSMGNLQAFYKYDPLPRDQWKVPMVPKDMLFADILKVRKDVIVNYHEHDSLLENKEDESMTEEERKSAWEDFEKERFMIENSLERKSFGAPGGEQDIEELTREVLRITGMHNPSGPNFPFSTPPLEQNPKRVPPFKIVNIHSKNRTLSPRSVGQNYNVYNFPQSSRNDGL